MHCGSMFQPNTDLAHLKEHGTHVVLRGRCTLLSDTQQCSTHYYEHVVIMLDGAKWLCYSSLNYISLLLIITVESILMTYKNTVES